MDGSVKYLNMHTCISISLENPSVALSATDNIRELLGIDAQDFISGKVTLQSRIHAHDQDIADVLFSNKTQPATGAFNIRLRHSDGRIRCIRGRYNKTLDNAGAVLLDLILEDSKSIWLQSSGNQIMMDSFKAMMESTDDYIYFKDINHVFTGASETLVALTETSEHWTDLIGKTDYDVFPEEYADMYYQLEKQVFSGIHVAHEYQETLDKNGNKGWVDNRKYPIKNDAGEIVGLFGIARDITANKLAEDALYASMERFRTMIEQAPLGVALIDSYTGHIHEVNQKFANIAGRSLQEMSDIDWMSITHPDDVQEDLDKMALLNAGVIDNFVMNKRYIQPDGRYVWINMTIAPLKEKDGTHKQHLCMIEDITERKQLELKTKLISERSQHLLALESFSEQLTEKEFMQHGQELAENITGSQISFIHFVNDDEETIELVAWSRRTIEHYCHAAFDSHYPVSKAGIWADALREKQPVMFNDYATYPHKRGLPEGHSPLYRLISVPVIENDKVVMLTGVGNKETDYTEIDIESVQLISNDIWRLVQRRRTENDQRIASTAFESHSIVNKTFLSFIFNGLFSC